MVVETGWFQTLEFPHVTALKVQVEKEKKFITRLEKQSSGRYVVFYRGLNDEEKKERKERTSREKANDRKKAARR